MPTNPNYQDGVARPASEQGQQGGFEGQEPGRTQTEAEGGERTAQFPGESTHTLDRAEGDPATIDQDLNDQDSQQG